MTREEKILMAIDKGIKCNPITGEVFGVRGEVITAKLKGYISIIFWINKKKYTLLSHQFIYYWVNKKCVDCLDHINRIKDDNRIDNLRSVTLQQNQFNRNAKGCSWHKRDEKWTSRIGVNGKLVHLGTFDTEDEASQAYLDAKKIYHI
jgi:hypothetical protein